jgi:RimJ/RimL family protein N-acetyltransferase
MTRALPDFTTPRLALRPRTRADLDAVMALNADPLVMRFIAAPDSPAMGRDAVAARSFSHVEVGLGYWSAFPSGDAAPVGYVGLIPQGEGRDGVQLSYRFAPRAWGRGYASEAAACLLRYGFEDLALPRIALLTHPDNLASRRLAVRLGFRGVLNADGETIGHPPVRGEVYDLPRWAWIADVTPPAA